MRSVQVKNFGCVNTDWQWARVGLENSLETFCSDPGEGYLNTLLDLKI